MSDVSTVFFPRKLVKEFITKYKECECLWNRNCAAYKVKMKRHQAITELTKLVQKYDPAATRVHILRKIDSLRACVRREHKKVAESKINATSDEEVYWPQLWYYQLFSFVVQEEEQKDSRGKVETKDYVEPVQRAEPVSPETEPEYLEEETEDERGSSPLLDDVKPEPTYVANCGPEYMHARASPNATASASKSSPREPRRKRTRPRGSEGLSGMDDEYDAIGMNVAAKLRYLPDNMRILAEKLISDVLFQAQTNGLTTASVLVTPDPFH